MINISEQKKSYLVGLGAALLIGYLCYRLVQRISSSSHPSTKKDDGIAKKTLSSPPPSTTPNPPQISTTTTVETPKTIQAAQADLVQWISSTFHHPTTKKGAGIAQKTLS